MRAPHSRLPRRAAVTAALPLAIIAVAAALLASGHAAGAGGGAPAPLTPAAARALAASPTMILLEAARFDTRSGPPPLAPQLAGTPAAAAPDYWIVQLREPVSRAARRALSALGGDIMAYVPNRALLVRMTPAARAAIAAAPQVGWIGYYHPAYRLSPAIGTRTFADPARRAEARRWLTVDVFPGEDMERIAREVRALGARVVRTDSSPLVRRLQVRALPVLLPALARLRGVQWIEEWGEITLRNNDTRWVVQSNLTGVASIWDHGLQGEGQIAGHIDTPLQRESCYFEDPVNNEPGPDHRKLVAYRSSSGYGAASHGTHTAGIIAGDQEPLTGSIDQNGIAHHARISHSNLNDITGFGNTTSNLLEYLSFAHDDGARVHTNSWGDDGSTSYTTWARDIDLFSRLFEDDLVGFAVTNMTQLKTPENAKNVLAVGASYQAPNQQQHSSGGSGPTADGRRKPEIYAPGRFINSARTTACGTISSSGTSMACPAVMGCAALARQYYEAGFYPGGLATPGNAFTPTGALVKATLLNASVDMDPPGYPTDTEGWGRVLLENALYFDGDARDLALWDVRHAAGLESGETMQFEVETVSATFPLRVTLVFTDEAAALGAALTPVNDLDLEVANPFASYKGNVFTGGWSVPGGQFDPLNDVEMVLLEHAGAARYQVRVTARQVAGATPQGFAVVVTGDLAGATAAARSAAGRTPPAATRLLAARPNPFRPGTAIDFSLAATGPVTLAVYDAGGRRVRTLLARVLEAGRHHVRWDGRDRAGARAASGVYLLRLERRGSALDTRKVVLLK